MKRSSQSDARYLAPLVVVVAVLSCAGCFGLREIGLTPAWVAQDDRSSLEDAEADEVDVAETSSSLTAADRQVLARSTVADNKGNEHSVWIRVVDDGEARAGRGSNSDQARAQDADRRASEEHGTTVKVRPRWHYPDLDELLARPAARQPDFHAALADDNPTVRTNAAMAMARLGDPSGIESLFETVQSPALPMPMRCAAVEALASLDMPAARDRIDELLDQYGRVRPRLGSRTPYVPELHEELLHALIRRGPGDDARLVAALRSPSNDVRLTAIEAFTRSAGELPQALLDLRSASHSAIRSAVLDVLARRRHPEALTYLTAALGDLDLRVRLAAIEGLGRLGEPGAIDALVGQCDDRSDHIRAAAVEALAVAGARESALDCATDESWRVRAAVAQALRRWPAPTSSSAAESLLEDPSPEVHRAVLDAVAAWPVELSGPVLLKAMGKRSLLCRKTAAEVLAARWSPAVRFPVEGPPARREEELQALRGEFRQQFGLPVQSPVMAASHEEPVTPSDDDLHRVAQMLDAEDYAALERLGPRLLPVLTALVLERYQRLPEPVYQDVLPGVDRVFGLIARLGDDDVLVRRRAADDLAETARERPLGRLAAARVLELIVGEEDQLVWIGVLKAVSEDGGDSAARVALAALSHPSPEVRRRGCLHLKAHPRRDAVDALSETLKDESDSVVASAVAALGSLGGLSDRTQLISLLRRRSESLQLEVASALVKLGDSRGTAALERLAYSRSADIRRQTADRMGELGHEEYVPTLIRLLDDRVSVMRAALAALPKVVGTDYSLSEDGTAPSTTDRVRRWRRWFESVTVRERFSR